MKFSVSLIMNSESVWFIVKKYSVMLGNNLSQLGIDVDRRPDSSLVEVNVDYLSLFIAINFILTNFLFI